MSKLNNFRDLGGLKTACGRTVRKNRLLRAAEPSGLNADEVKRLTDCGLVQIIDLRRPWEIELAPVTEISGVDYLILDVKRDRVSKYADEAAWRAAANSHTADEEMRDSYHDYVELPSAREGYAAFLRALAAKTDGATLFHCHAGKDRTGFAAGLILKLLGVADEDIYDDYLKTLEDVALRLDGILESRRAAGYNDVQLAATAVIYSVKREYLEAAFAAINEHYGDFDRYVAEGLGITAGEVELLKELYLE